MENIRIINTEWRRLTNVVAELLDYFEKFELFEVTEQYDNEPPKRFHANRIMLDDDEPDTINFGLFCADTTTMRDNLSTYTIKRDGSVKIECGEHTATIIPAKVRTEEHDGRFMCIKPEEITLETFMREDMADKLRIKAADNRVFIPINVDALGLLTDEQERQIRSLLDYELKARADMYQTSRVPGFVVTFYDKEDGGNESFTIAGSAYAYGEDEYLTFVDLYDSEDDTVSDAARIELYKRFAAFAKANLHRQSRFS